MSKKSRQERKAAKAALEQATLDAAALNAASFNTAEEANAALADASRVIDMKAAKARVDSKRAKGQRKSGVAGSGKLPAIPRARGAKRERPVVPCECGCGGTTKSRFCPGHDSYLRGLCLRVHREIMTLDDVAKLVGGAIGQAQRAAVEKELRAMKKEGKLTNKKVTEGAVEKTKAKVAAKAKKAEEAKPEPAEIKEGVANDVRREGVGA